MGKTDMIFSHDRLQGSSCLKNSRHRRLCCMMVNWILRITFAIISRQWHCTLMTRRLCVTCFQAVWVRWQSGGFINLNQPRWRVFISFKSLSRQDLSRMRSKPTRFGWCKSSRKRPSMSIRCAIVNVSTWLRMLAMTPGKSLPSRWACILIVRSRARWQGNLQKSCGP